MALDDYLANLNPPQQDVVRSTEGAVRVIAGSVAATLETSLRKRG